MLLPRVHLGSHVMMCVDHNLGYKLILWNMFSIGWGKQLMLPGPFDANTMIEKVQKNVKWGYSSKKIGRARRQDDPTTSLVLWYETVIRNLTNEVYPRPCIGWLANTFQN